MGLVHPIMRLRDEMQKRIEKKQQEIRDLELQQAAANAYLQALQDSLRLLPTEAAPEKQGPEQTLRPGSAVAKARQAILRVNKPLHVTEILKAIGRDRPVGMVHIDAHCDTSGEYEGAKFHHGGPFRHAVLAGVLDPERCIQIGIRGGAEFLWEFSYESGMTVLHIEDVTAMGIPAVVARAREVVGDGPVYVTFDVDGVDPAFAPGTGTPEVGGLTPREVLDILRGLAGLNVVGGDVVEVAPQYDATTNTAHIAAQGLFTLLCLVAMDPKRQRKTAPAAGRV